MHGVASGNPAETQGGTDVPVSSRLCQPGEPKANHGHDRGGSCRRRAAAPVPGIYVNPANGNRIQLNPDASFVAQDTGRSLTGRYSFNLISLAVQNKNNLQLAVAETGSTVFLGLQNGKITDQAGNAWEKQSTDGAARLGAQRPGPLAPIYVSSQNTGDRLQLNRDRTFSLQEGGQSFSGTYSVAGTTLTLHIVQLQKDVDIAIQGNRLIVNGDEVWIQPNQ